MLIAGLVMVRVALLIAAFLLVLGAGAGASTVTADPDAGTITMSGQVVIGDLPRFEDAVLRLGDRKDVVVILFGPGGKMMEGLKIGLRIHQRGWATRVEDGHVCLSTCAMIWLAGHSRFASTDAHIGFHAPFDGRTDKVSDVGIHVVGTYCDALGLTDKTATMIVFKTPGQGMTWLDAEQAQEMGIAVTMVPAKDHPGGHFSTAALDEQDQAMAHFRDGGPRALAADLDACYAAYERRRLEAIGFRCFFLEGLASSLVRDKAKKDGYAPNPYFAEKEAIHRIVRSLIATGHTKARARAVLASWQADLKVTAKEDN